MRGAKGDMIVGAFTSHTTGHTNKVVRDSCGDALHGPMSRTVRASHSIEPHGQPAMRALPLCPLHPSEPLPLCPSPPLAHSPTHHHGLLLHPINDRVLPDDVLLQKVQAGNQLVDLRGKGLGGKRWEGR